MKLAKTTSKAFAGLAAAVAMLYTTTALSADLTPPGDDVTPPPAERLPAVSGFNGKLDFSYLYVDGGSPIGNVDEIEGAIAIASVSAPLGQRFGLQLDFGLGRFDASGASSNTTLEGVGAHLFTRDPEIGLLGVYGHYVRTDFGATDITAYRYGVEGELYLNQVSLEAFVGADHLRGGGNSETYANLDFTAAFYATDNVRIEAGVLHQFNDTFGKVGFEAALPFFENNTSVYANATFGDDDQSFRAGFRIYFGGGDKSLKDRHRQDDPKTRLVNFNGLDVGDFEQALGIPPVMGEGGAPVFVVNPGASVVF